MLGLKVKAKVSELQSGEKKTVRVGLRRVLLVNVDGNFYAVGSRCPHLNRVLLDGSIEGNVITCPHHGSKFDIITGKVLRGPASMSLPTYKVRIEGEDVLIYGESSM